MLKTEYGRRVFTVVRIRFMSVSALRLHGNGLPQRGVLRRVYVEAETFCYVSHGLLGLYRITGGIERRREGRYAHHTRYDTHYSAADTALGGYARLEHPVTRALVEADGRHERDDARGYLRREDLVMRDGVEAVGGDGCGHDGELRCRDTQGALARIDVGCGLKEETATGVGGFALKTVSIYRTNNKGYAAPVDSKTITDNVVSAVSVPSDAGTNDVLTYTCTDDKSLLRTIYIAEAEQGTNKDNNICLVIGGIYTGNTYYYRVDLTVNGSYIPIKRNCRYIINIKAVNSIGYTTEEEALHGDIVLSVTADLSAEAWGSQTEAGKGTITLL